MLTNPDIAVGQQFVKAFAAGDLTTLLSVLHRDVTVTLAPGLPYGGSYRGIDGFLEFAGTVGKLVEIRNVEAEILDAVDKLVARIDFTFVSRATGRELRTAAVELYTVVDGKIHLIEPFYFDTRAVAELLD